jgi:hypothetical protein
MKDRENLTTIQKIRDKISLLIVAIFFAFFMGVVGLAGYSLFKKQVIPH